ncbi:MAG: AmmeMemoRadiSam system protein A [Candidatus Woesearchaeota archaeon]
MLSKQEKEILLEMARKAIMAYPEPYLPDETKITAVMKEKRGVFVSLHLGKSLRGCIGYILPVKQLYQAVIDNAVNAAYRDSRFPEPTKEELRKMTIEISVLTVPEKVSFSSPEELLKKLDSSKGVIIEKGLYGATFLPQVWEELPEKEEFLGNLCLKAGLMPEDWKECKVSFYTVECFSG